MICRAGGCPNDAYRDTGLCGSEICSWRSRAETLEVERDEWRTAAKDWKALCESARDELSDMTRKKESERKRAEEAEAKWLKLHDEAVAAHERKKVELDEAQAACAALLSDIERVECSYVLNLETNFPDHFVDRCQRCGPRTRLPASVRRHIEEVKELQKLERVATAWDREMREYADEHLGECVQPCAGCDVRASVAALSAIRAKQADE